ncbi:ribosomal protection-like ABC-F family protein [Gracilibacillus alcaliphilus]|uniref:ribosomal protection-like ABC-F family protein n=1 Tax=Gracilibacillus alcaliphilus TaxID=1401441 RepID=UPI0019576613|nr:ABC-F type ribosomal protection protein [Gracilibacillus alcaliphilus]MBM7676525.1 ATPase subunit of ABC transporter with duplicated ATPase domains [Gracilibacillus alcaliphilus]
MIVCSVQQVAKNYGGNPIFEQISFEIKEQERIALVGRNGSGKTTLLKLLAGEDTPDNGQIHWQKGAQIGYLKQIADFDQQAIVQQILESAFGQLKEIEQQLKQLERAMGEPENQERLQKLYDQYGKLQEQFLTEGGYEIEAAIRKVVSGLQIKELIDQQMALLSGGERTKVGLAYMLLQNPDLLLLDEPTNHLDLAAVEWLGNFLQNYQGTVIIVSHDRYFLDEVVTQIVELEEGEFHQYHTNYSDYIKEKEERLLREFQQYQEQQNKIKKMKEAIKRLRDWANRANPPNAGLHKRARNMERALERMEKLQRPILERKKMNLDMSLANRSGKDVVILEDVSKGYGDSLLFQQVNMHITYQQKEAIVGENGTGKSTLLKLILQQIEPDSGKVNIGSRVKIGYLSQHVFTEQGDQTVLQVFRDQVKVTEGQARHILAGFLFYGYDVFQKVKQLSGGEKMRLRLAQIMHQDTNFLVLDEPTNHLDIDSLEVLEDALADYDGTILAVSHDRYFLDQLFDRVYWIDNQQLYGFEGNYSWAREKMWENK